MEVPTASPPPQPPPPPLPPPPPPPPPPPNSSAPSQPESPTTAAAAAAEAPAKDAPPQQHVACEPAREPDGGCTLQERALLETLHARARAPTRARAPAILATPSPSPSTPPLLSQKQQAPQRKEAEEEREEIMHVGTTTRGNASSTQEAAGNGRRMAMMRADGPLARRRKRLAISRRASSADLEAAAAAAATAAAAAPAVQWTARVQRPLHASPHAQSARPGDVVTKLLQRCPPTKDLGHVREQLRRHDFDARRMELELNTFSMSASLSSPATPPPPCSSSSPHPEWRHSAPPGGSINAQASDPGRSTDVAWSAPRIVSGLGLKPAHSRLALADKASKQLRRQRRRQRRRGSSSGDTPLGEGSHDIVENVAEDCVDMADNANDVADIAEDGDFDPVHTAELGNGRTAVGRSNSPASPCTPFAGKLPPSLRNESCAQPSARQLKRMFHVPEFRHLRHIHSDASTSSSSTAAVVPPENTTSDAADAVPALGRTIYDADTGRPMFVPDSDEANSSDGNPSARHKMLLENHVVPKRSTVSPPSSSTSPSQRSAPALDNMSGLSRIKLPVRQQGASTREMNLANMQSLRLAPSSISVASGNRQADISPSIPQEDSSTTASAPPSSQSAASESRSTLVEGSPGFEDDGATCMKSTHCLGRPSSSALAVSSLGRTYCASCNYEARLLQLVSRLEHVEGLAAVQREHASAREASLLADLEEARSHLESFERLQSRRYQEMDETYRENFNAVGLVESRLDDISAHLDMRRRQQVWRRVTWLLVDALAWLAWLLIWLCTFIFHMVKRCRRSVLVAVSRWQHRFLTGSFRDLSASVTAYRSSSQQGEKHQKPSAVATRFLIRMGHVLGFSTPALLAPSAAQHFASVGIDVRASTNHATGQQLVD